MSPNQEGLATPVKGKREPPRERWNLAQKAAYATLFTGVLCFWTIPLIAVGFVGLLAFIVPGLVIWVVAAAPLVSLMSWYKFDDPFMQR